MNSTSIKCWTLLFVASVLSVNIAHGQSAPSPSPLDIMSVLPGETELALVIPKLSVLNDDRWGPLFQVWGWPEKPMAALFSKLEIVTGINGDLGAAVAVLGEPAGSDSSLSQRLVLLLPTTNRNALLTFLSPQLLENGYVKIRLRDRDSFAGTKGSYTVIGPTLEAVRRVVESTTALWPQLTRNQTLQYSRCDAAIWIGKNGYPLLNELSSTQPEKSILTYAISLYGTKIETLIPLRVEPDGLALKACIHHPLSDTNAPARFHAPMLLGLPNDAVVFAGGVAMDDHGHRLRQWITQWFVRAQTDSALPPTTVIELMNSFMSLSHHLEQLTVSVSLKTTPSSEPTPGLHMTLIARATRDVRPLLTALRGMVHALKSGIWIDPRWQMIMDQLTYRNHVERAGLLDLDHLTLDLQNFSSLNQKTLRQLFGTQGPMLRVGFADLRTLVITMGGGLPRFQNVVSSVRSNHAPILNNALLSKPSNRLPGTRHFELHGSVALWAKLNEMFDQVIASQFSREIDESDSQPVEHPSEWYWTMGIHRVTKQDTQVDFFLPNAVLKTLKTQR